MNGSRVARGQAQRHLVELRQPYLEVTVVEHQPRRGHLTEHERRQDSQPVSEVHCLRGMAPRRFGIAGEEPLIGPHHREQCMGGTFGPTVDERLRTRDPPTDRGHQPAVDQEVEGHRRGGESGGVVVALLTLYGVERLPRPTPRARTRRRRTPLAPGPPTRPHPGDAPGTGTGSRVSAPAQSPRSSAARAPAGSATVAL
ncbi:hypothetical protein [Nocardioides sp. B-3]|uniref:hypothetical protein n=1 Tax=Nocardioides sp. B-3 TaxID=2895565 RepID=UPI0021535A49|nr:hypothetical protein [Nocardioides sp. B-3]UUZ60180.1 hypothetical protein LP418_04350 [Nocardioides sp. B-3]